MSGEIMNGFDLDGTLIKTSNESSLFYKVFHPLYPSTELIKIIQLEDIIITGRRNKWYIKMMTNLWMRKNKLNNKIIFRNEGSIVEHKIKNIKKYNIKQFYENDETQREVLKKEGIHTIWDVI